MATTPGSSFFLGCLIGLMGPQVSLCRQVVLQALVYGPNEANDSSHRILPKLITM